MYSACTSKAHNGLVNSEIGRSLPSSRLLLRVWMMGYVPEVNRTEELHLTFYNGERS